METVRYFDGDYNILAEKAGESVVALYVKCSYCGNTSTFSILSKYQDANLCRDYDEKSLLESVHWEAKYLYLLSCPQCEGVHLCEFYTGSENENMYEAYIESYISSIEGGYIGLGVDYLKTCNFKIIYPQYTKKDLLENNMIKNISPNFIEIYNQAQIAEKLELNKISGMSYRKALEFLIKDFAIYLKPSDKEKIAGTKYFLGTCIKEYYDSMPNVKECAERAAWLGNDETHYTRKWEDKDIEDLKKLIEIVMHGIEMKILADKYIDDM